MSQQSRRKFITAGVIGGIGTAIAGKLHSQDANLLTPTPKQMSGPFYPVHEQEDKDVNLVQIQGREEKAKGDVIHIQVIVKDTMGNRLRDVVVDMWQANAAGRYTHPNDNSDRPLDPNFQGWAIVPTNRRGRVHFKTIMPGAYGKRTPHIHFKFAKTGYKRLTTQMYFPEESLNKTDRIFNNASDPNLLVAKKITRRRVEYFRFVVVLEKA